MRKGEIVFYKQFLVFSQCFPHLLSLVHQNAALCDNGIMFDRSLAHHNQREHNKLITEWICPNLTHYRKMPHFDTLQIYCCGKQCEKRRNCL